MHLVALEEHIVKQKVLISAVGEFWVGSTDLPYCFAPHVEFAWTFLKLVASALQLHCIGDSLTVLVLGGWEV